MFQANHLQTSCTNNQSINDEMTAEQNNKEMMMCDNDIIVSNCINLIEEGRYLAAREYIDIILSNEYLLNNKLEYEHKKRIIEAYERLKELDDIIESVSEESSEDWIEAMTILGITTSYITLNNGLLKLKIKGSIQNLPLPQQVSVLREADLYNQWIPFCDKSHIIKHIHHNELISYLRLSAPLFSRDAVIHAYGADCILERNGLVILVVKSIDEYDDVDIPPINKGFLGLSDRMIFHSLNAVIQLSNANCADLTIVCSVDPKTPLPYFITNYVIKNIAGVILYCHRRKSTAVLNDPNCEHALRIKNDTKFYTDWLLPKILTYYNLRGWSLSAVVDEEDDFLIAS